LISPRSNFGSSIQPVRASTAAVGDDRQAASNQDAPGKPVTAPTARHGRFNSPRKPCFNRGVVFHSWILSMAGVRQEKKSYPSPQNAARAASLVSRESQNFRDMFCDQAFGVLTIEMALHETAMRALCRLFVRLLPRPRNPLPGSRFPRLPPTWRLKASGERKPADFSGWSGARIRIAPSISRHPILRVGTAGEGFPTGVPDPRRPERTPGTDRRGGDGPVLGDPRSARSGIDTFFRCSPPAAAGAPRSTKTAGFPGTAESGSTRSAGWRTA